MMHRCDKTTQSRVQASISSSMERRVRNIMKRVIGRDRDASCYHRVSLHATKRGSCRDDPEDDSVGRTHPTESIPLTCHVTLSCNY